MDKIKNTFKNNKVLFILLGILIICFVAILIVVATYFWGGNKSSYGDRLKDIDKYPVTEEIQNNYLTNIKESEYVSDVNIELSGRIIYINVKYSEGITLDEGKSIALKSLEDIPEDLQEYYDILFYLESKSSDTLEGFSIFGAKNVSGTGLIWNNNREIETDKEDE